MEFKSIWLEIIRVCDKRLISRHKNHEIRSERKQHQTDQFEGKRAEDQPFGRHSLDDEGRHERAQSQAKIHHGAKKSELRVLNAVLVFDRSGGGRDDSVVDVDESVDQEDHQEHENQHAVLQPVLADRIQSPECATSASQLRTCLSGFQKICCFAECGVASRVERWVLGLQ